MGDNKTIIYVEDPKAELTPAILDIIESFPPLEGGEVSFSQIADTSGKSLYPTSGSYLQQEREDVTGHVMQICNYPFAFLYRGAGLSESRKIKVKEWLDKLGSYVQRETITYNNNKYQLADYPPVDGKAIRIMRPTAPAYLESIDEDNIETWIIPINLEYQKEFDR